MGVCFLYGNGGASKDRLKLRIFGGTTAPSSPQENDIWVKTSTKIVTCGINHWVTSLPNWTALNGFVYIGCENVDGTKIINIVENVPDLLVELAPAVCWQYENETWSAKDAYLYKDGNWVQFSGAFSARINVVYPAGSTCTISNGSKTYTAPSTGGYWECDVDSAGTWTVTATNGPQSASQSVSITASGQTAGVTLAYDYKIFNAGGAVDYSGGWTGLGNQTVIGTDIQCYVDYSWAGCQAFTNAAFDVSNYTKLNVNVSAVSAIRDQASFGLSRSKPNTVMWNDSFTNKDNCAAILAITSTGVKTLDISGLSGNFYFWTGQNGTGREGKSGFTIDRIWLS